GYREGSGTSTPVDAAGGGPMKHAGFLTDICAHPEDDAPRLIYADWLEENGETARAEFIRLQIELARRPGEEDPPPALLQREGELLDRHGDAWRADLPALPGVSWVGFQRGFVQRVTVQGTDAFLTSAEPLFAAAPVRSLKLRLMGDGLGGL